MQKKSPLDKRALLINWQRLTLPPVTAVPSALTGLTSLFGMGRGGPRRYNHHKICLYPIRTGLNVLTLKMKDSHEKREFIETLQKSLRVISTAQL